jgi:hypothetical protein
MALRRYTSSDLIAFGTQYGTGTAHARIRKAIVDGSLDYTTMTLKGFERLDTIAGKEYGDSTLWWVLAAASGIGWGLQVPPDTIINVPNIQQVTQLVG